MIVATGGFADTAAAARMTPQQIKGRRIVCAVLEFVFTLATRLRAGVPQAVRAEIRSRGPVVGAEALYAIRYIVAAGSRGNRHRAVVIILVVVIGRAAVAIPIRILRSDRAADHRTCDGTRNESAAAAIVAAAITAAAIGVSATAATAAIDGATSAAATGAESAATATAAESTATGRRNGCATTATARAEATTTTAACGTTAAAASASATTTKAGRALGKARLRRYQRQQQRQSSGST